jgi:hypothetical protein
MPGYGYLKVTFADSRQVFVNGGANGLTNVPVMVEVGDGAIVTLAGNDYDPPSRTVDILLGQTTGTSFTKLAPPPVVAANARPGDATG